jgi:outer membrane protein assembly factor BamB
MLGVTPQRTLAYNTRGVGTQPRAELWKTDKLFSLKSVVYERAETGPFKLDLPHRTFHGYTPPVLADGVIYLTVFNDDGYIFALTASDGKNKSRYKRAGVAFSSLAIADGVIYLGGSDGVFRAFDINARRERWQVSDYYSFNIANPVVADGLVYFAGGVDKAVYDAPKVEGIIYSVDAQDGKKLWTFKVKGTPTPIAVDNGTAYFGDGDQHLFAIDGRTGEAKWTYKADSNVYTPAIMNGSILFRDHDRNLYAVELKTGKLRWKARKLARVGTLLAVDKTAVYFGGQNDSIYAVDALTGEQKWKFKTNQRCNEPVLAGGSVYFGCLNKKLYAVDAITGQEKWQYKTAEPVATPLIISDGTIYFLDSDAYLYAIR